MEQPTEKLAKRPVNGKMRGPANKLQRLKRDLRFSTREQLFIEYYLMGKTAVGAARLAGYPEGAAQCAVVNVLRKPDVWDEINTRATETFHKFGVSHERTISEIAKLAYSNMLDYIEVDARGNYVVDLKSVDRDMGAAITELSYDNNGRPRIRLADKKPSLELLAKIQGKLSEKVEVSGKEGGPLTVQTLDKIIQQVTINQQFNVVQQREQNPADNDSDPFPQDRLPLLEAEFSESDGQAPA